MQKLNTTDPWIVKAEKLSITSPGYPAISWALLDPGRAYVFKSYVRVGHDPISHACSKAISLYETALCWYRAW